jgi:hypothetical protein
MVKKGVNTVQKLASKPLKTAEEIAYEEYLKEYELAMENH